MSAIYVNAGLEGDALGRLQAALADRDVAWGAPIASELHVGAPDPALAEAGIVFGQPDPDALLTAPRLRLVQLTSAGWARYDREDLRDALRTRGAMICSASTVFAEPVAEHGVAVMLSLQRRLPEAILEQHGERRWRQAELRAGCRLVASETVLFLANLARFEADEALLERVL